MLGTDDWQEGMKNVTMTKLASLVDDRMKAPRTPQIERDSSTQAAPHEESQSQQVKVFLNPLVMMLAGAEKQKGRPLTQEEVLEVRDQAAFVMLSPDQAEKFYASMDSKVPVHRINPDRVWEEWQEIRDDLE